MPVPEIRAFSDADLDAAGELLAERHRRHRAAEPLLPARYEDPAAAREEVQALWGSEGASGAVATRGGRVVAYVIGIRKADDVWGANAWIETAGHAAETPEDVRDAYAAAATRWVDEGRTRQYAVVPAADAVLVDAWFRLGFGGQQATGVMDVPEVAGPAPAVRAATEADLEAVIELAPTISDHQVLAPTFSGIPASYDETELRSEVAASIANADYALLLAEVDGRVVGGLDVYPVEISSLHEGLMRPDRSCYLGWAAVTPQARGSGAGVALTNAGLAWARAHGYTSMVTDWRMTNLLSSRFWPKRGFRTSFLRLYRSIP